MYSKCDKISTLLGKSIGLMSFDLRYPGQGHETVSFVGSHMDVVPANPEEWTVSYYYLKIEYSAPTICNVNVLLCCCCYAGRSL